MNLEVYKLMVETESRNETILESAMTEDMRHRSGELYDILCQNTTGEALSVIKMVGDMEGIKAWQVLFKKYNPKTMARGVRLLCEVTNPPKIKDLSNIESEINRWEEKSAILHVQFGEELSNKMKIAVFANMMPVNIQEHIYATVEESSLYNTVKEKVRAMVQNKLAANMGPAPMDIGDVTYEEYEGDYNVDVVDAETKCYRCQGYGHMSRDCGTKAEYGKGKGSDVKGGYKGKGKGSFEKGFGKSSGKDNKGKGKGKGPFMGSCWKCGKTGHKSNECYVKVNGVGEEEAEDGHTEIEVGGVWMIGAVDVENTVEVPFHIIEKRRSQGTVSDPCQCIKNIVRPVPQTQACHNMFNELAVDEHEDEDIMIGSLSEEVTSWTRSSGIMFHVADVAKPLASAVKVVEAGNRVVMDPVPGQSYVENIATGERMLLKKDKGTYVFEVQYLDDGKTGCITLDSGAGVSVWPKSMKENIETLPKAVGLNMVAANGTRIANYGQKLIKFKGQQSSFTGRA